MKINWIENTIKGFFKSPLSFKVFLLLMCGAYIISNGDKVNRIERLEKKPDLYINISLDDNGLKEQIEILRTQINQLERILELCRH